MSVSVFLSHTAADKPFVRRLAADLESHGVRFWLDEAEIKVGESLIAKIQDALDDVDFVAAILSPRSIDSAWVQRELEVALTREIGSKRVVVLPVIFQKCRLPSFLATKKWVDFSDEGNYLDAMKQLLDAMGVVFNRLALDSSGKRKTLQDVLNVAIQHNLLILSKPYHRPFQYIGMRVSDVERNLQVVSNSVGNIVIESSEARMFMEAEGAFISFVEVDLLRTIPSYQNKSFNPEPMLGALSINPDEMELVRSSTHSHTYYDHRKKLKVNVMCVYDDGPISVAFSSKYYGM